MFSADEDPPALDALPTLVGQWLARAVRDKRSPLRWPVVATVSPSGRPHARMMVVRRVDDGARTLDLYTDARSPKRTDLACSPRAEAVFWDPKKRLQLRMEAFVRVLDDGPERDAAWSNVREEARADYARAHAPGALARDPIAADARLQDDAGHFAIVRLFMQRVDVLRLAAPRPWRAEVVYNDGAVAARWLTP